MKTILILAFAFTTGWIGQACSEIDGIGPDLEKTQFEFPAPEYDEKMVIRDLMLATKELKVAREIEEADGHARIVAQCIMVLTEESTGSEELANAFRHVQNEVGHFHVSGDLRFPFEARKYRLSQLSSFRDAEESKVAKSRYEGTQSLRGFVCTGAVLLYQRIGYTVQGLDVSLNL